MPKRLIFLAVAAAALSGASNAAAAADRHPGVYQFAPLTPGWCATQAQGWRPKESPARLARLGDLPPAYAIRVNAPAPATPARYGFLAAPPILGNPAFDPCAHVSPALVRVR
jgi:hypothetical protein